MYNIIHWKLYFSNLLQDTSTNGEFYNNISNFLLCIISGQLLMI